MSTRAKKVFEDFPYLSLMLVEDNKKRLKEFLSYKDNWNGEGARSLDVASLRALNDFIERHSELFPPKNHLSLFLTTSGTIEVAWGDDGGKGPVEMEFFAGGSIEYLVGDAEGVANQYTGNLYELLERLRVHHLL